MKNRVVVGLGSNLGNRLQYLQRAIVLIYEKMGNIMAVSSVYETPSWGFDSHPFYNACILVETEEKPAIFLEKLLEIEAFLGRKRESTTESYQARTIDLDILLWEDSVIFEENLTIPHPKLPERKFVLKPLLDICPFEKHPILKENFSELLKKCDDFSEYTTISEKIFIPQKIDFEIYEYIAIEGNIGAGKTSLAKKISENFNRELLLERYADNPFLEKFYEDKERYAFALEIKFLLERHWQTSEYFTQNIAKNKRYVADYEIFKSLIFAKVTLSEEEFELYETLFHLLYKQILKPDLYVYIYQNTENLLKNIQERGRAYEKEIEVSYLNAIQESYLRFLSNEDDKNLLFIDMTMLDFVKNEEDFRFILHLITQNVKK